MRFCATRGERILLERKRKQPLLTFFSSPFSNTFSLHTLRHLDGAFRSPYGDAFPRRWRYFDLNAIYPNTFWRPPGISRSLLRCVRRSVRRRLLRRRVLRPTVKIVYFAVSLSFFWYSILTSSPRRRRSVLVPPKNSHLERSAKKRPGTEGEIYAS